MIAYSGHDWSIYCLHICTFITRYYIVYPTSVLHYIGNIPCNHISPSPEYGLNGQR